MSDGFNRDKTVDSGGFRGLIPENTAVPVVLVDCTGKLVTIGKGDNAGRTARLYSCTFEVAIGKYAGGRIWHDLWCNVEPDPAGGKPEAFGPHAMFCDLCDLAGLHDEESGYPLPENDDDMSKTCQGMVGTTAIINTGMRTFKRRDQTTGHANTAKSFTALSSEQKELVNDAVALILQRVEKQKARQLERDQESGFTDENDEPIF
jgi:hypothetical protein